MKEITRIMYKKYALNKLKYDFMGYEFQHPNQLSFHHLIIPRRLCKTQGLGEGYYEWNGAILTQCKFSNSHDYLHIIERYDLDIFNAITSEMIDENIKGYLDIENLKNIDDILKNFEREYCGQRTKRGYPLIREEYTRRLIRK